MQFVDPKSDIAFKKIFGDIHKTEILISFLNAVLDLPQRVISVELVSPYQVPHLPDFKNTCLDVKAKDALDREFIVEMQVEGNDLFGKRALYYTAKSYSQQIKRAEQYEALKPVYFVGILNFNMFDGADYLTRHLIMNQQSGRQDLSDFEFSFVELPKFNKPVSELQTLSDQWIYFMKNAPNLDMVPPMFTEREILEAFDSANKMTWTPEELAIYDSWSVREGDRRCQLKTAERRGLEEGLAKGREEEKLAIAMNLLDVLDDETIALKTGLTVERITALRQQG